MLKAVLILVLLILIYCLTPTFYYLYFRKPPFKLATNEKRVMLSFDDGPDPRYTGRLLDILKANNIHATFFVVAEKAYKNPDLIRRIIDEGHLVGLHSLEHRDAWCESPAYQKRDIESGLEILKELGCDVSFYRAPWGHLNLTSLILAKKYGLKIILWSVMAQDWEKNSTALRVLGRLTKRTTNGSVLCLHDSGCGKAAAEGAPAHTIEAVSLFLPAMLNAGYRFVFPDSGNAVHKRQSKDIFGHGTATGGRTLL